MALMQTIIVLGLLVVRALRLVIAQLILRAGAKGEQEPDGTAAWRRRSGCALCKLHT